MLTDDAALALVQSAESQYLERKEACPKASELRSTLCAFANSTPEGRFSALIIGVHDRGAISGVADNDLEPIQQTVLKAGREDCYPPIHATTQVARISGKSVIIALIGFSKNRPHFTGHSYVRVGPRSEKSDAKQFEELILSRSDKIRRILADVGREITVELPVPPSVDPTLHATYSKYNGLPFILEKCDAFVIQIYRFDDPEKSRFGIPIEDVTVSFDTENERLKLIILPERLYIPRKRNSILNPRILGL